MEPRPVRRGPIRRKQEVRAARAGRISRSKRFKCQSPRRVREKHHRNDKSWRLAVLRIDRAEMSCARCITVRNSHRHEDVRAFKKSWARMHCRLRFRSIFLDTRAGCFPATAPARPRGCKSRRSQLRSDDDRIGQLRSCCSCAVGQRTCPVASIFKNSGVGPVLGSIAVSWRVHFRACAARARLARSL